MEKVVEVDRPISVPEVRNHISVDVKEVERWREKVVPVKEVVEKIV